MKRLSLGFLALWVAVLGQGGSACSSTLQLWDVAGKQTIPLEEALPRLTGADVVAVGEIHDRMKDHEAQLAVLQAIHGRRPIAVGLEMFQRRSQLDLDHWIHGKSTEAEFEAQFQKNWGANWPLYRDIFLFCRSERIPMVGLNVPREITSKVARKGFASLSPEEIGLLPPITCRVGKEYAEIMRQAHGHAGMSEAAFNRFCEAQLVWDASMAVHAEEYLKANAATTLIVLAGAIHAWRPGIPEQLKALNPNRRTLVVLPESEERFHKDSVTVEDCDFLVQDP